MHRKVLTMVSINLLQVPQVKILIPNFIKNLEPPGNVERHGTKKKFEKIVPVLDILASILVLVISNELNGLDCMCNKYNDTINYLFAISYF